MTAPTRDAAPHGSAYADTLRTGDTFLRTVGAGDEYVSVTVLADPEPDASDPFGRTTGFFKLWCRREDTGAEGWARFGPNGVVTVSAPDDDERRRDEVMLAIEDYVRARPDRDFNASQLARAAKCNTAEAHAVLNYMVQENYIKAVGGGGAWRRYRHRRFGELNG